MSTINWIEQEVSIKSLKPFERWQKFTGNIAINERDGEPFKREKAT